MQGASLILASYQQSLGRAMDITANNIANMNTTGFKREAVSFDSYLIRATPKSSFEFAIDQGTYRDTAQGSTITTGNPLDISVQGEGYIPVQTKGGIQYTRGGAFQLNPEGELVTALGDKVLGDGNQILAFPTDSTNISISPDGMISASSGSGELVQVGKLSIMSFENEQELLPVGNGMYISDQAPKPATQSNLLQGSVEQSNVSSVREMTRMIEISRAYERTARMLDTEHKRQTSAIQKLGKLN